jgi:hypothetical protein
MLALAGFNRADAAVLISTHATQNMSCLAGVCTPTAAKAWLNTGDLETMLASGNATVKTTGNGVQAKDIAVDAAVAWSSGSTLTLDAYRSVTVNRPVSVQALAGLSVLTNDGGKNGLFLFGPHGNVTFANLSSSLSIDGTPYQLENSIQSLAAAIANNPSGAYALANSYDASQDGTYSAVPIPTTLNGILEGLGNAVSGLSIEDANDTYVGLFAKLGAGGTLSDVSLTRTTITSLTSAFGVGALVGDNDGAIIHASAIQVQIDATAAYSVGGLVGCDACFEGVLPTIERSFASGSVAASSTQGAAGGLVGDHVRGTIALSHADAHVSGLYAGGLAGSNDGTIELSYALGTVPSGGNSGGLVGSSDSQISNSYAMGKVAGTHEEGGLLGAGGSGNQVSTSYSTTRIEKISGIAGGFIGWDIPGDLQFCYWDTDTSKIKNLSRGAGNYKHDPGITGLSTTELQSALPPGFDPKIWAENPNINDGLPYLIANPPSN